MNEEIPPQVEQVPQDGQGVQGAQVPPQDRAMTTQVNLSMVPRVVERTMTSRLRYFVRINSPIFLGSKVGDEPQEFLDGVYKMFIYMGVKYRKKVELASCQLRNFSQIWYTQWKDNRIDEKGPIEWEEFKESFLEGSNSRKPNSANVKLEKGGSSQKVKPTCAKCGKKHYGECLLGTRICFGCGKEGHKVRDCPMVASKGRDGKQVAPSVSKDDAPTKMCSYALRSIGEKPDEINDDVVKFSLY
ncbi:hypothetical protein EJD97_004154 [Solanum chilense]|uniref:CCHC-type domain-containing protein n=1 Tax=Solanum chilense TaxID=4083 RepID=A0A6N2CDF5_SOLCI|nr:hypothetical protein EJD97_004154 [Solanum chilense]